GQQGQNYPHSTPRGREKPRHRGHGVWFLTTTFVRGSSPPTSFRRPWPRSAWRCPLVLTQPTQGSIPALRQHPEQSKTPPKEVELPDRQEVVERPPTHGEIQWLAVGNRCEVSCEASRGARGLPPLPLEDLAEVLRPPESLVAWPVPARAAAITWWHY